MDIDGTVLSEGVSESWETVPAISLRYVDLRSKAGARLAPFLDVSTRAVFASLVSSFLTIVRLTVALIFQLYDTTSSHTHAFEILELHHQFCDRTS
jgi:hypothetical protein